MHSFSYSISFILLLNTVLICASESDILSTFSHEGKKILNESASANETIRQCWCEEESICMKQLEKKLEKCSNKCWDRDATKITTRPDNLWQCFVQQKPIADRLIRCIKSNIKSCANSKNGPQIPKQDIRRIISLTGEKIEAAKDRISSNPALQPIRKILDTALEIGKCVKDCLIEGDGIIACFEKHACQPQINLNRSRRTILKCIKQIGWRKAAGEMCKCTMEAGVSGLTSICPIFDLATRD